MSNNLLNDLLIKNKHGYLKLAESQKNDSVEDITVFCDDYKDFLNKSKTERESVIYILDKIQAKGFEEFDHSKKYQPGDKIYYINRDKALIMATIGTEPLSNGVSMLISHIDSPRIDLTPKPLFEDSELTFFKSQYYGGIKKYQWTTIPLSIHGVIEKKDGSKVEISLGEKDDEPVFCITDLLPHLAEHQMKRSAPQVVKGDELNILIGSIPHQDEQSKNTNNQDTQDQQKNVASKFKLNVMKLLNQKYGITEYDLISADISFVPAFKARDIGFDSSMIGAYGHDDRVCAYTSLQAHLSTKSPTKTVVTVFTDKEEIGSEGNTGLKSNFFEYFIYNLSEIFSQDPKQVLTNSVCLSADVTSAFDPTWREPFDSYNSAYLNHGVAITKYNGCRGKYDTSEASPKLIAQVRKILDDNNIIWQTGGLGKVDVGGGGTISNYVANLDVEVLDIGVPVLSMHSPFETVSKLDVYMTYKAFAAFISR